MTKHLFLHLAATIFFITAPNLYPVMAQSAITRYGTNALAANTTGDYNSAFGYLALRYNTSGSQNVATGTHALYKNTTGNYNTASGHGVLYSNTKGIGNTAIGSHALFNNTTGTYNTAVGYAAGFNSSGFSNSTALGYNTQVTASNQVRIGNSAVTSIGGYANWSKLSDGRFKHNVQQDVPGLAFITQLRPVTYTVDVEGLDQALSAGMPVTTHKEAKDSKLEYSVEEIASKTVSAKVIHTGFVAQEVEEIARKLHYEFSGVDVPKNEKDFYGLRYAEFVVPLVKAVQELNKKDEELTKKAEEIDQLKKELTELRQMVLELKQGSRNSHLFAAYLEQSTPNPSSGIALIRYYIPQNSGAAHLVFTDIKGAILKSISVNSKGTGQFTINTAAWTAGTYTYTLYINGSQADSKKLVIAR
jgi:trimeric autotransporter adhesin